MEGLTLAVSYASDHTTPNWHASTRPHHTSLSTRPLHSGERTSNDMQTLGLHEWFSSEASGYSASARL